MALTVSLVTNNEGLECDVLQMKGVNDGSSAASAVYIGFVPRRIEVLNLTDGIMDIWTTDMGTSKSFHMAANGAITTPTAGFTVFTAGTVTTTVTATGSPLGVLNSGFSMDTNVLLASKTFDITCWR
jgi:hypothetical protein